MICLLAKLTSRILMLDRPILFLLIRGPTYQVRIHPTSFTEALTFQVIAGGLEIIIAMTRTIPTTILCNNLCSRHTLEVPVQTQTLQTLMTVSFRNILQVNKLQITCDIETMTHTLVLFLTPVSKHFKATMSTLLRSRLLTMASQWSRTLQVIRGMHHQAREMTFLLRRMIQRATVIRLVTRMKITMKEEMEVIHTAHLMFQAVLTTTIIVAGTSEDNEIIDYNILATLK